MFALFMLKEDLRKSVPAWICDYQKVSILDVVFFVDNVQLVKLCYKLLVVLLSSNET